MPKTETLESSILPSSSARDDGASSLQPEEGESSSVADEVDLLPPENENAKDVGNSSPFDLGLSIARSLHDKEAQGVDLETKPSESTSTSNPEESEAGFSRKGGISEPPASSETTSTVTAPDTCDPMDDSASDDESATTSVHGDNLLSAAI